MMGRGPMGMMDIQEEKAHDTRSSALRLFEYVKVYPVNLVWIVLSVIVTTLTRLAQPWLVGVAIDQFISVGNGSGLNAVMVALLATYAIAYAGNVVGFRQMSWVGQHVLFRMRSQIFDLLQRLPLGYFDTHEIGDLMSRLTNDTQTISNFLGAGLNRVIGDLLSLIGIVIIMLLLSWQLALASFIVLPLMWVVTVQFSSRARSAFRQTRRELGRVNAELEENIAGMKEVQAFSRERVSQERFSEINARNRDVNVGANAITSAFNPAVDFLSTLSMAIVIGYGAYLVVTNQISVGVVVSFLLYVQRFFEPVRSISQTWTLAQSALAAAERIYNLLDEPAEMEDAPEAKPMPQIHGDVVFDNVTFGYNPNKPVLFDIDLEARQGQTIALVGPTGAGKTSIVNLLMRFYDPQGGAVLVDGIDIRTVQRASLRRQMGMVLQEAFLFSGTIADNIRFGKADATMDEIVAAAKLVNADEFIRALPEGYDTPILERGANLSQGQKQLIAFARAVITQPRILILDEATSSVDTRTEAMIQDALGRLLKGRTSFVVAHRLSTIRNADEVLVMMHGRVVERGTHETLMAQRGVYWDLVSKQTGAQQAAANGKAPVASVAAS
ncbi:MAG: ABC transporter ATP-binding protein [Anaerolineae bacterium]